MAHMEWKGIRETSLCGAREQGAWVAWTVERHMGGGGILPLRMEVPLRTRKASASTCWILRRRGRNQKPSAPLARNPGGERPEGLKEKRVKKEQRREPGGPLGRKEQDRRIEKLKNKKNKRRQGGRGQEEKRRIEEQKTSKEGGRRARVPVGVKSCRRKRRRKKGPGGQLRRQQKEKSRKTKQQYQKEGARVLRKKGIFVVDSHGGSKCGGAGHGRRSRKEESDCMQEPRERSDAWPRKEKAEFSCKKFLEFKECLANMAMEQRGMSEPRDGRGGHGLVGIHYRSGSRC